MDYIQIGRRIRNIRKSKNMTQEKLAEIVDISLTHMSHIETGSTKLSLPVLADVYKRQASTTPAISSSPISGGEKAIFILRSSKYLKPI